MGAWVRHTIEAAATGAAASDDSFTLVNSKEGKTVILFGASGLGDVTADLQIQTSIGWEDCYDDNGKITLSASRNPEVVYGPGTFRLNFTTRTNSVGAEILDLYDSGAS